MGRPQVDSPAVYPPTRSPPPPPPPQSDPQPQPFPYATEHDDPTAYPPEEISPAAYESYQDTENPQAYSEAPSSYPPPQNDSTNPRQFPSQNPPNNMAYPPQAATYPPNNPPQAATYPPNTPPQAATYPPNNPPPAFPKPMGYGPQPVNFPPRDPPPPPSPHKPFQQNVAAQGIPVQQQFAPVPVQRYGPNMGTVAWTTGLFDCMDDPQNALITAFFPCLTFGQVAEIVDSGHTTCGTSGLMYGCIACLIALPCLLSCTYRTKLRSKYDLVEAPAPDWATHFLCEWCALCQEYRELRNRGLDPELGWHGNMMKNQNQQPQVAMMPPMNQSMMG